MQLLKGESSRWLNLRMQTTEENRFRWAKRYFAASVSVRSIEKVRKYIYRQWEHHHNELLEEEYNRFLEEHGFQIYEDNPDKEDDPNRAEKVYDFPPTTIIQPNQNQVAI